MKSIDQVNRQVRRNRDRFPPDFMFQLTMPEARGLLASRSRIATLKRGQNIKYRPHVFTEHGAVMLASILNSPIAVQASIQVVRAFIRLREMLAGNKEFARKLADLERRIKAHDAGICDLFEAIRRLSLPSPVPSPRRIGFLP